MAAAKLPTRSMCQGERAIGKLGLRCGDAAQLAHRFDHFRHPAAIGGMIVAKPAAIGVHRQAADARDESTVGSHPPRLTGRTEAEIFKLNEHGDGEAVVE